MSWRSITHGLRVLLRRDSADDDLRREIEDFVERRADELVTRGVPRSEARRQALLEMGNPTVVREKVRSAGWESVVASFVADVRYALRRLRAAPVFTAATLFTLALGIGATTAIFSAVNGVLFAALPYPSSQRLAMIVEMGGTGARGMGTFGMYRALAERARGIESIAVFKPWQPTIVGGETPERLNGQRVTAGYFDVLGVHPSLGRTFRPSEDIPQGAAVVVISDALWRRRFAADSSIVGRRVLLDDSPSIVIGVMPRDFDNVLSTEAEVWAPLQYDMASARAWGHHLTTIGRLRDGTTFDQATREIDAIGRTVLSEIRPETYDAKTRFRVLSMRDELTRGVRPALLAVLAASVVVLLIACVNVTNLLLARGVRRRGEYALRAALGAGGGRLVRQLLTESLVLATLGGCAAIGVAVAGTRLLALVAPPELPRAGNVSISGATFAIAFALTACVALALGAIPAIQAARNDPQRDLHVGSRRVSSGRATTRGALVVAEVALALVLLVTSGLLVRSVRQLLAVPLGFDSAHLLTLQVQAGGRQGGSDSATLRFYERSLDALRALPGVVSVGVTSQLPLSRDLDEFGAGFEESAARPAARYSVYRYAVSPRYLETMGVRLLSGRLLDERDRADAPRAVLISESLARLRFGNESPLGARLTIGGGPGSAPFTIVGVVADVKQQSLAFAQSEAVYTTTSQWRWADNVMTFVVRARGDAASLVPDARRAIWSVDRDQPIVRVATMDDLVARSAAQRRFVASLFEAFAIAALLLAAAGIYGVLATAVAERLREIGVRAALGAPRASLIGLVTRQGLALASIGLALGLVGAIAASRAMRTLLFEVSPFDPATYAAVVIVMLAVSAAAAAIPAWRAARVDPAITLRSE